MSYRKLQSNLILSKLAFPKMGPFVPTTSSKRGFPLGQFTRSRREKPDQIRRKKPRMKAKPYPNNQISLTVSKNTNISDLCGELPTSIKSILETQRRWKIGQFWSGTSWGDFFFFGIERQDPWCRSDHVLASKEGRVHRHKYTWPISSLLIYHLWR